MGSSNEFYKSNSAKIANSPGPCPGLLGMLAHVWAPDGRMVTARTDSSVQYSVLSYGCPTGPVCVPSDRAGPSG